MTTVKTCIRQHPMIVFFALTFIISWGGILILGSPYGMPAMSEQSEKMWPIVFLPYFLGPGIAGLLLTGLTHGRRGFRDLSSRMLRWRVNLKWYAAALLIAPILVSILLLILSQISQVFLPGVITSDNRLSLIILGIVVGLIFGGLLEELGWTGFAIPVLRQRHGIFITGLIIGILWGVWHFLPTFWGSGDTTGKLSISLLLPPCLFYIGVLPAYRILMVWVYERAGNSFLIVMLMHMSLTASTLFILAPSAKGASLMIYYVILSAVMWIVVGVAAKTGGWKLTKK